MNILQPCTRVLAFKLSYVFLEIQSLEYQLDFYILLLMMMVR